MGRRMFVAKATRLGLAILKSGFDWIKMLGRGDLIAEIAEVPRRDGEGERTAVRAPEMYTSGENCRSTLPPEIKSHNYI